MENNHKSSNESCRTLRQPNHRPILGHRLATRIIPSHLVITEEDRSDTYAYLWAIFPQTAATIAANKSSIKVVTWGFSWSKLRIIPDFSRSR